MFKLIRLSGLLVLSRVSGLLTTILPAFADKVMNVSHRMRTHTGRVTLEVVAF